MTTVTRRPDAPLPSSRWTSEVKRSLRRRALKLHAMRRSIHPILLTLLLASLPTLAAAPARAQWVAQRYTLADAERQELSAGRDHLKEALAALKEQSRKSG